jgi:hypothetical protein
MNAIEAKGPKGPKSEQWQVAIPDASNLTAFCDTDTCRHDEDGNVIFENQGSVSVVVSKSNRRNNHHLVFMFDTFDESRWVNITGLGVSLASVDYDQDEGPCDFPTSLCSVTPPGDTPPGCMACFLNGDHPHHAGYDFSLQVVTDGDIEESDNVGGNLYIDMWQNVEYHWISCDSLEAVDVTRSSANQWTVTNNDNAELTCEEFYLGGRKGKHWEGIWGPHTATYTVMTATTDLFEFETIWTKQ